MRVLFEDRDLIVVVKPAGVLSEEAGNKASMPLLLRAYLEERGGRAPKIYTVHRLDRDVGGVMVFAKNAKTASELATAIAERRMEKEYLAVLCGAPEMEEDVLEDLLFRDAKSGKTYVVDRERKGVRDAKLSYKLIETVREGEKTLSLVRVKLYTGRTHQIRVQFASRKLPLYGDGRYGGKIPGALPALFSTRLALPGRFDCAAKPEDYPFSLFGELRLTETPPRT